MAGLEKEIKKAVKGKSSGKKSKSGGHGKGGSSIEKKAKKLLK